MLQILVGCKGTITKLLYARYLVNDQLPQVIRKRKLLINGTQLHLHDHQVDVMKFIDFKP